MTDTQADSNSSDDNGNAQNKPLTQTVGFWDSSLARLRTQFFLTWARTVLTLAVFILSVLSLYWGVLFHIPQNLSALTCLVVDFDGSQPPYDDVAPLVGPMVTQIVREKLQDPQPHLGYEIQSPSNFGNDPIAVREAVFEFNVWAAIVVNPNATSLLRQAVTQGNTSYDPSGACQLVYIQARDQTTFDSYITPELNMLQTQIVSQVGQMWTKQALQDTSIPSDNLQLVTQALSPAIGFSQYNLRPFNPAVATPAVTIGLIYLIILSFFSFSFFLPNYMTLATPTKDHPAVPFWQLIAIRFIGTECAYFLMSLAYSLISLAFQIPFANPTAPHTVVAENATPYGKGTFVVYWMINFVGMSALGLACENVTMIIGQPWTGLWLIFWVISNVSTSFYSLDLAPRFYYWGYAWPLQNIVEASRSTLFGLHSRLGLNFGVLFTWVVIGATLFPLCCHFMRWKTMRQKRKEAEDKEQ